MKKVLYISYDGLTDPLGQSQILPYIERLAKEGYQFTILSFEKSSRLKQSKHVVQTLVDEANIRWIPLSFTSSPPIVSKIYDQYRMRKTAEALYKKEQFDLVHCRSYIAAQVGLALKEQQNVPFLFDMRGFWADEKKESGRWKNFLFLYDYYKRLEKKLLARADGVVSLTEAAKKEIGNWNQLKDDVTKKIEVIPCCVDLTHFSPEQIDFKKRDEALQTLGIDKNFPVICYLGSLGSAYGIKEMLQFFNLLKQKCPAAKFLFFTKDDKDLVLTKLSNYSHIDQKDLVFQFIDRKLLPTYISLAHYSLFFYYPTYSRLACSPTKFAELSAMGVPVICNAVGDINKEYLQGLDHLVLDDLSEESMQRSIDSIEMKSIHDAKALREFALQSYSLEKGVQQYKKVYKQIIK